MRAKGLGRVRIMKSRGVWVPAFAVTTKAKGWQIASDGLPGVGKSW